MSIALARKYRPQLFADLIGQEPIAKTLQQAIAQKRVHHAYIFTGTRGVGKTTTARIFAKALNCHKGPASEPCNACPACDEITVGSSVDVLEIDAASHTKVEETRDLLGRVAYSPAGGKYRIFIIDEAHMLSKSSFNALLKTLEEPPAHAVFILATTEPQKILDTVRSRCIEFVFRRITAGNIALNLRQVLAKENIAYDEDAVVRLSIEADGSMRDALSLADQVIGFAGGQLTRASVEAALGLTSKDIVAGLWAAIFSRDASRVHGMLADAYRSGADLRRLGIDLAEYLRQTIVSRTLERAGDGLLANVVQASQPWSLTDVHRMFDRLHAALLDVERSPVPDIVMETALLRLAVLEPLGKLEDLLAAGGGTIMPPTTGGRPVPDTSRQGPGNFGGVGRAAAAGPAMPTASAPPPPADSGVIAALAGQFPSLAAYLTKYATWDGKRLAITLPPDQMMARTLFESETPRLTAALAQLGHGQAPVSIIVAADAMASATQVGAVPALGGKRALLDDERLRALLKAFPGAEVVDVRRLQ